MYLRRTEGHCSNQQPGFIVNKEEKFKIEKVESKYKQTDKQIHLDEFNVFNDSPKESKLLENLLI